VTGELIPWEIGFGDHFDVRTISRIPLAPGNCCVGWVDTPDYEFVTREARDENRIWAIPRRRHWWQPTSASGLELPTPLGVVSSLASDLRTARLFVVGGGPNRGEFVRFEPFSRTFSPFLPGVSGNHLDFSRDGKWIAYTAVDERAVLVSRANGKEGRQLTFSFDQVELPRWSPDGTKIAFMGRNIGWPWRIYVVPSEGGTPREASVGRDNQGAPTWSPDGKWLAYANVLCQESHTCSVHRIELATGKIETLPGSAGLQTARWSPDGRYIAALRPEQHQLLVFDTEKQNWTKLADSIVGADLNWSRDSRYLYSNRPVGYKPEILRIPVNGGNPENVVNLESLGKLTGRFSDGLSIAPDNSVILIREINASEIYALDFALTGR
jgi:dipeptidyl aminopeptidase/acylaminoacyl peptidase